MGDGCTPRVRLRLPIIEDSAALASLMIPSISARLASWPPRLNLAEAEQRIRDVLAEHAAGLALPMVVTRPTDGAVMGWIGACRTKAAPRTGVMTYWLGEPFQNLGLMREVARPAAEAMFRVLGLDDLQAAVQDNNDPSLAILRGLGMRKLRDGTIWCASRGREEACQWWHIAAEDFAARPQAVSAPCAARLGSRTATPPAG
jgi:RimJ/RimL family protein N-acetyltransferase